MKTSRLAKERPDVWLERIGRFQRMVKEREAESKKYRDAAELKFRPLMPQGEPGALHGFDVAWVDQIPLNVTRRYIDRLKSLATDGDPLIVYPRDAEGDEEFASFAERLLTRVVSESRYPTEFGDATTEMSVAGSGVVWFGYHQEAVTSSQVTAVSQPIADVAMGAMQGAPAVPGQDHVAVARTLVDSVSDPKVVMGVKGEEVVLRAYEGAAAHVKAAEKEEREPDTVWVTERELWTRHLPMTWVAWDVGVYDLRDARWMARKIVFDLEEARTYAAFDPRVRGKLQASAERSESEDHLAVKTERDGASDGARVVVWEVWDKRYRVRHYVSESVDEYLEADAVDPYLNEDTGRSWIPGFFPCIVTAPLKAANEKPERTLGVPPVACGFPQQEELIKLRSYAMACAKRTARFFELHAALSDEEMAAISAGQDGFVFVRPGDVPAGEDTLKIHQFQGEFPALRNEAQTVLGEWCATMEFPMAELTTMPQAETATQEQIGVAAGSQRTGFIVRTLEEDFARGVEILRALVCKCYNAEKVASLVGAKYAPIFQAWTKSSLKGDKLTVKFKGRAEGEKAVQLKQSMDLYMLLKQEVGPLGLPKYRTDTLLEDVARRLGHQLVPYVPTQEELAAVQMKMMGGMGGGDDQGEGGPPTKSSNGQARPQGIPGRQERAEAPPDQGRLNGGARRLGPL